jgi:hypothetical protein
MTEITSLAQARRLHECHRVPPADLGRRADQLAADVDRQTRRGGVSTGDVCPHSGGDYWLHYGPDVDPGTYFCNIPPGPARQPGLEVTADERRCSARRFLEERNAYLERVLAYFEEQAPKKCEGPAPRPATALGAPPAGSENKSGPALLPP